MRIGGGLGGCEGVLTNTGQLSHLLHVQSGFGRCTVSFSEAEGANILKYIHVSADHDVPLQGRHDSCRMAVVTTSGWCLTPQKKHAN